LEVLTKERPYSKGKIIVFKDQMDIEEKMKKLIVFIVTFFLPACNRSKITALPNTAEVVLQPAATLISYKDLQILSRL
jgi:hypothetical protein